jgi:hypothetical protein
MLGLISGVIHFLGYFLPSIISFLVIVISVGAAELYRYKQSLKFATEHPTAQDPLLSLINRFNHLNLATRILHIIQLIRPIANFLSSLILTVILIVGILNIFYHDILKDELLLTFNPEIL